MWSYRIFTDSWMFCVPRLRYNNPGEKCPLCFSLLENPNRPYISLHLIVLQPRFHHQCYPNVIHMSSTNLTVCIVLYRFSPPPAHHNHQHDGRCRPAPWRQWPAEDSAWRLSSGCPVQCLDYLSSKMIILESKWIKWIMNHFFYNDDPSTSIILDLLN